jgi:hypothetical protein
MESLVALVAVQEIVLVQLEVLELLIKDLLEEITQPPIVKLLLVVEVLEQ